MHAANSSSNGKSSLSSKAANKFATVLEYPSLNEYEITSSMTGSTEYDEDGEMLDGRGDGMRGGGGGKATVIMRRKSRKLFKKLSSRVISGGKNSSSSKQQTR